MTGDEFTREQAHGFDAVMDKLRSLPTPELIFDSGRLRFATDLDQQPAPQLRATVAGSIAAQKVLHYLPRLRRFNEERLELGSRIQALHERAQALSLRDPLAAIEPTIEVRHLAGEQEVAIHGFAMCVRVIYKLLQIAAKASGYKIPKADLETLKSFEPLRHFYEHLDERLPGGKHATKAVVESTPTGVRPLVSACQQTRWDES